MGNAKNNVKQNAYLGTAIKSGDKFTLCIQGAGPCHGGWQRNREKMSRPLYAFSSVQEEKRCPEIEKDFYTFLANESCFKDCFISKDYEDILENGWVLDCSQPANIVANAAIATRFYTEHYSASLKARHPTYLALRELGIDVWESYFFAHVFTPANTKKAFPCSAVPYRAGHTIFQLENRPLDAYKRMLKGVFDKNGVSKESFMDNDGYTYGTLDTLWGKQGENPKSGEWFQKFKPIVATAKVNLNIFEKKVAEGYSLKSESDLLSVVEQIKEALQ